MKSVRVGFKSTEHKHKNYEIRVDQMYINENATKLKKHTLRSIVNP